MDLGFSLKSRRWTGLGRVTLADIKAVADQRRVDSPAGFSAGGPPSGKGRQEAADWVHILACRIAPGLGGPVDATPLGGSFNPLIARQLMVGERVKAALTLGL